MTGDEMFVLCAYRCVSEVLRSRHLVGTPVPAWLREHFRRLDTEIRMSRSRHENGGESGDSVTLIGSSTAGEILDLSTRQVQRIAEDLGGHAVDGRWVFNRAAVENYARTRGTS